MRPVRLVKTPGDPTEAMEYMRRIRYVDAPLDWWMAHHISPLNKNHKNPTKPEALQHAAQFGKEGL